MAPKVADMPVPTMRSDSAYQRELEKVDRPTTPDEQKKIQAQA